MVSCAILNYKKIEKKAKQKIGSSFFQSISDLDYTIDDLKWIHKKRIINEMAQKTREIF